MYAPPHEFDVNIPKVLNEVRAATYASYAWPQRAAAAFRHGLQTTMVMAGVGLLLAVLAVWMTGNWGRLFDLHTAPGSFYEVVPYIVMILSGSLVSAFVVAVLYGGLLRFWRQAGGSWREFARPGTWLGATVDALKLRYLDGGGPGCYYPERDRPANARRIFHSLVFYGFAAAFISTVLAAIWQDFLGELPPYPVLSAPVLFGMAGGVGMIVGCTGLLYLKTRVDRALGTDTMRAMDIAFLFVLDLASLTGMLTLALRGTRLMGMMLVLHLAVLVALYATFPYGKFVHAVYRFAGLLLHRAEQSRETA
jgi:citrate/tricarballylate utilization protein